MKATYLHYSDGSNSVSIGGRDLGEATANESVRTIIRLVKRGPIPVLVVLKGGLGLNNAATWATENLGLLDEMEDDLKVEVKTARKESPSEATTGSVDFHC